jgi:hypothetical protein
MLRVPPLDTYLRMLRVPPLDTYLRMLRVPQLDMYLRMSQVPPLDSRNALNIAFPRLGPAAADLFPQLEGAANNVPNWSLLPE